MSNHRLVLECLNGPYDGHRIEVTENIEWRCTGAGPLVFPWDDELDDPQARISLEDASWSIQHAGTRHGTYCVSTGTKVGTQFHLLPDMVLKASYVWLRVIAIE